MKEGEWKQMQMNRIQLIMLSVLSKVEAKNPATSVSIDYIIKSVPLGKSYSTIYREINALCQNDYISQGVKDGKFNTYYINKNGIEKLKEML